MDEYRTGTGIRHEPEFGTSLQKKYIKKKKKKKIQVYLEVRFEIIP